MTRPPTPAAAASAPVDHRAVSAGARTLLICNSASGSNDDEARDSLVEQLRRSGLALLEIRQFPEDGAPTIADLRRDEIDLLVVFAGDGTTHSVVTGLFGWEGAVLVLPGGTKNLLAKRLHGDTTPEEIVGRLAAGAQVRTVRPTIIESRHGFALTGVLCGPGAVWNEVREAMRDGDAVEFLAATVQAIAQSTGGPKVACRNVDGEREEGYAAITVNPHETGLEANGYHAETIGDFARQGVALLQREFRNGPHDSLGRHSRLRIVCPEGEPMGLLIDGEPFDGQAEEVFELAACGVDLLATADAR